jgi:hypothetical protein
MSQYQHAGRWFHLVVYMAAAVALLYLLFAAGTVLVACNLWWFLIWYKGGRENHQRGRWLPWILAQLGIILCYLPGLEIMISVAGKYASQPLVMAQLAGDILKRIGFLGFAFSIGETFSPVNPAAWVGLSLVIIAVLSALIHLRKVENILLPVMFLVVIGSVNVLISLIPYVAQTWQNLPYRMLYGYPFFVILLAVGLDRLRPWLGNVLGVLLLGVFVIGLYNYYTDRQFIRPIYTVPWRQIFNRIQAEEQPGAVVICNSGDYACLYYSRRYFHVVYGPANWQKLASLKPAEVWWIESNKGTPLPKQDLESTVLQEIQHDYQQAALLNYAPQDPSIRWIKARLLKREDYVYRVNIYQFRLQNSANN